MLGGTAPYLHCQDWPSVCFPHQHRIWLVDIGSTFSRSNKGLGNIKEIRYACQLLMCFFISCAPCNNAPVGAAEFIWIKNKVLTHPSALGTCGKILWGADSILWPYDYKTTTSKCCDTVLCNGRAIHQWAFRSSRVKNHCRSVLSCREA